MHKGKTWSNFIWRLLINWTHVVKPVYVRSNDRHLSASEIVSSREINSIQNLKSLLSCTQQSESQNVDIQRHRSLTFSPLKMMRLRQPLRTSIPSLRSCWHFTKSYSSSMPTPLTREMFISPNYVKVATSRPTMFKVTAEGTSISQFPIPASVRESSIIPDGYSVGGSFNRQRLSVLC